MDEDLIKKRRKELSKQQAMYVAYRERGHTKQKSAVLAGYADVDKAGYAVEKSLTVQEELEKARREVAEKTGITRDDVVAGMLEAVEMAKVMGDPQSLIRAWSEIGKIHGHYAPELKRHVHGLDKESREALKAMPDNELRRLAKGRVIDVEVSEAVEVKNED